MRLCTPLLLVLVAFAVSGCSIRTTEEEQAEEALRQATANLGADIFEAANAIEKGVPWALPVAAIKVSASTIIHVNGRNYQPATVFMSGFSATNPSPVPPGAKP